MIQISAGNFRKGERDLVEVSGSNEASWLIVCGLRSSCEVIWDILKLLG